METPQLTHVRVNVRDLATSLHWYEGLFGVPATNHYPPDAPTYAHFTLGPAQFALGQYEPAPATGARFNFEVNDVNAWWSRVEKDADVVEPLQHPLRHPQVHDSRSDGNELGFVQA